MQNTLLDLVFSFIGVSSKSDSEVVKRNQTDKLNMFATTVQMSRSTAGTTTRMGGDNQLFFNTIQARQHLNKVEGQEPELLPVSCGYFNQIVHQLLLKQRKLILKYILLDTKGMIFDRLLKYLRYHSLTELLIELMKLNLRFDGVMWTKTQESKWSDEEDEKESSPEKKAEESKSPEQTMMLKILDEKKLFVV